MDVSVTGLGVLRNTIAEHSVKNQIVERVRKETHIPISNLNKTVGGVGLMAINGKHLYYRHAGNASGPPVIFIHGKFFTSFSCQIMYYMLAILTSLTQPFQVSEDLPNPTPPWSTPSASQTPTPYISSTSKVTVSLPHRPPPQFPSQAMHPISTR